jgi:threonine synthase
MSIRYVSTRGQAPELNFEDVLLAGLASDGGLYVPTSLPTFSREQLVAMQGMSYPDLAYEIVSPFVGDCTDEADLRAILSETYAEFRHPAVAPLIQLDHNQWVLELFQGPTLAFKDFALQLLGRLLDHVLARRGEKVVIMGATSGDTGSAAIEGCRRCENIDIFILHPHERVSEVQRRQMTTVIAPNIHNLAIQGNFDDCQAMVKASFVAEPFLPDGRRLVAVNSINWARIMAQIVYYFYSALALGRLDAPTSFSVPTGNFGDIFAGYLAKKMGLPVEKLVIATNKNDVLHRVLTEGVYSRLSLEPTLSPSMDITVSSNFERLLFDLAGRDGEELSRWMTTFAEGGLALSKEALEQTKSMFDSHRCSDDETCEEIAQIWANNGYLIDPHTAIGTKAARVCHGDTQAAMVTLATAHPAKFPAAIDASGIGVEAQLPHHLADLFERPEAFDVLPNDLAEVQSFMAGNCRA